MYNTHFVCTYKMHDVDEEETQDIIYRYDYLSAFGLKEYDSDIIMKTLEEVYEKLKFDKDFIEILEAHPRFVAEKKNYEFVMQLMFSFDTLDLFHLCLIYLLYKYIPMPSAIESSNAEAGIGTGTREDTDNIDNISLYVIPKNVYSYFTFLDTKNKLIEILKI
jgi:hypothetical protein